MSQTIIKVPAAGAFDPTDIEITDGVDDAFLIKDTSNDEWFKIDTRAGTTANGRYSITMAPTSGQRVLIGGPNGTSGGPFSPLMVVNQNNDSYAMRIYGDYPYGSSTDNHLLWGRDAQKSIWRHPLGGQFEIENASGTFDFRDSGGNTGFEMDNNRLVTFRANVAFRNKNGNPNLSTGDYHLSYNGGSVTRYIEYYGTPSTQNASHNYGSRTLLLANTFKYGTAATAAGTVTLDFQVDRNANTNAITTRYVTFHNLNATYNATFEMPVASSKGTAFGQDTDATNLITSSTGITLTPGQAAVFEVVSYNALGTDAGMRHYVRTVGKG